MNQPMLHIKHRNNMVAEEVECFRHGLDMANKYRKQNNLEIRQEKIEGQFLLYIIKFYEKYYHKQYNPSDYTRLDK